MVATLNTARTARARSAFLLSVVGSSESEALDRASPCVQRAKTSPQSVSTRAKAVRRPVEVEKLIDHPVERTGPAAATELSRQSSAPIDATPQRASRCRRRQPNNCGLPK